MIICFALQLCCVYTFFLIKSSLVRPIATIAIYLLSWIAWCFACTLCLTTVTFPFGPHTKPTVAKLPRGVFGYPLAVLLYSFFLSHRRDLIRSRILENCSFWKVSSNCCVKHWCPWMIARSLSCSWTLYCVIFMAAAHLQLHWQVPFLWHQKTLNSPMRPISTRNA